MSFDACDTCTSEEKYRSVERITLIGGINVTFCNACHNRWNEYATNLPEFKRLREINRLLDCYEQTNMMFSNQPKEVIDLREDRIFELNAEKDVICNEKFVVIAKAWLEKEKK